MFHENIWVFEIVYIM